MAMSKKRLARGRRQERVRRTVRGSDARPRLCVYKSNKHIYVQVISDQTGRTLAAASSLSSSEAAQSGGNKQAARQVGAIIARTCHELGIRAVVFDRNGFLYHGRVQALADAAREAGLQF
jgi:large subunit ribosomal protein L18